MRRFSVLLMNRFGFFGKRLHQDNFPFFMGLDAKGPGLQPHNLIRVDVDKCLNF